jgi:DNA (cytosine-5)-methyltransferase 1
MQVISLFSGIGGFEDAAQQLGWDNVVSCEINKFGKYVLEGHWPNQYHHDDIHTLNYETIKEKSNWDPTKPTIIVGGFPCQPYSTAGKRLGKNDERHLWPEMLRLISEIKPDFVVGENVRGLLSWSDGLVFEEVCTDLESQGYEVWPYILPAAGVGAPHRRDRIWFIAHRASSRREHGQIHEGWSVKAPRCGDVSNEFSDTSESRVAAHTNSNGIQHRGPAEDRPAPGESESQGDKWERLWAITWGTSEQRAIANTEHNGLEYPTERGIEGELSQESRGKGIRCSPIYVKSIAAISIRGTSPNPGSNGSFQGKREGSPELNNENAQTRRVSTHTYGEGLQRRRRGTEHAGRGESGIIRVGTWDNFPTQSPLRNGDDGFRTESLRQRLREDSMGHLSEKEIDQIISSATTQWANETIKAGGNAIVPQVAINIFKSIQLLINENT